MRTFIFLISICCACCSSLSAQTYNEYIAHSFDCIEKKEWGCAEEALLSALRKEPANPQNFLVLSNLGTIQRNLGKFDEALKSYTNALFITPRSVTLLKNRASLYVSMDSIAKALTDYSSAISIDDKEEDALYDRGMLFLDQKDTASARHDFEHILKINPGSYLARVGLATLMKYRNYYKEALTLYDQLISQDKDNPILYFGRAETYLYLGKISKANEDIKRAMLLDSNDPLFYLLRSKIRWAQFEKDAALADLEKALSLGASAEQISIAKAEFSKHDKGSK